MKYLKLTFIGLLALTAVASDAFAFGPPGPPIGGPPMGGLPHPPMGGPPMGGLPHPPIAGGMPATPFGGGPPHPPMGGGPAFSGNVFGGPRGPAGNFSGNLAARGPTGNAVNSGNTVNVGAGRYYGSANYDHGYGSGNYGRGYGYYSGGYGSYRNGSFGERRYWGAYAAGVATGAAAGEAASTERSSTSYNYYTPPYYYYTCWDASTGSYYSSAVQCSQ